MCHLHDARVSVFLCAIDMGATCVASKITVTAFGDFSRNNRVTQSPRASYVGTYINILIFLVLFFLFASLKLCFVC